MDEMRKAHDSAAEQPAKPERRQWHTPQFFVAGLAATVATHNAASDGRTIAPTLS
jgi:hypothetical protein